MRNMDDRRELTPDMIKAGKRLFMGIVIVAVVGLLAVGILVGMVL